MAPRRRSAARLAAAALVLGAVSASSQAAVVKIDAGQSSVTYTSSQFVCDPSGSCTLSPVQQTFALSGSFNVVREAASTPSPYDPTSSIFFTRISFDSISVDAGGAGSLGFSFPSFAGIVNGTSFMASDNPCFFGPGTCWVSFTDSTYTGDFDDHTLIMSGVSPQGFFDSFTYQIVATAVAPAATVPEPGTLACVAVAGAGWAASRRRRGRRDIQ